MAAAIQVDPYPGQLPPAVLGVLGESLAGDIPGGAAWEAEFSVLVIKHHVYSATEDGECAIAFAVRNETPRLLRGRRRSHSRRASGTCETKPGGVGYRQWLGNRQLAPR